GPQGGFRVSDMKLLYEFVFRRQSEVKSRPGPDPPSDSPEPGFTRSVTSNSMNQNSDPPMRRTLFSKCLENRKCTTKQMRKKWMETGVDVCDRTVRNRLQEVGFTFRKAKRKPSLTPKQKRTRLQGAKEKHSWTVDDWMKVRLHVRSNTVVQWLKNVVPNFICTNYT
uniref:Transposase Tc1-like domain-containing protein n=1 Tax=Seriola dumerili TaxID=41447 RepID=A0A3B4TA56_SERDU